MSTDNQNEEKSRETDAYYEELACQEEIYLEETEEEVHLILESYDATTSSTKIARSTCGANRDPRPNENLDEQLDHAAEELITGDADDPPLAEEAVVEMLKMAHMHKKSEPVN